MDADLKSIRYAQLARHLLSRKVLSYNYLKQLSLQEVLGETFNPVGKCPSGFCNNRAVPNGKFMSCERLAGITYESYVHLHV